MGIQARRYKPQTASFTLYCSRLINVFEDESAAMFPDTGRTIENISTDWSTE